jgi:hypothetical protein
LVRTILCATDTQTHTDRFPALHFNYAIQYLLTCELLDVKHLEVTALEVQDLRILVLRAAACFQLLESLRLELKKGQGTRQQKEIIDGMLVLCQDAEFVQSTRSLLSRLVEFRSTDVLGTSELLNGIENNRLSRLELRFRDTDMAGVRGFLTRHQQLTMAHVASIRHARLPRNQVMSFSSVRNLGLLNVSKSSPKLSYNPKDLVRYVMAELAPCQSLQRIWISYWSGPVHFCFASRAQILDMRHWIQDPRSQKERARKRLKTST